MAKYKIIMTGGGSAGHVTPNLALIPTLEKEGFEIQYIGTADGIERKIISQEGIKYHVISSGKLRRYFDLKNFTDPFRVIKGVFEAKKIIKKEKPDVIFSKGGFVAVPVVIGAFLNKVPVVSHESDITPGLANKIALPYSKKVCVTFPETMEHIKKSKVVLTGTPIRKELLDGSRLKGLSYCGFSKDKPVLLVIGGSLGSKKINDLVRKNIGPLLEKYQIIHICGKNNLDNSLALENYKQFEFVSDELPDLLNCADIVVSRAGANVIFELLALKKPNLLIPLSKKSSRGDQILNARSFEKKGYSLVLEEEDLEDKRFIEELDKLYENRSKFIAAMDKSELQNAVERIVEVIKDSMKR
ncbi:MAG: undecaprenyldiphospho-muramoylpentapeptide beta-N-acetylglucosaminyltransferase [Clostridiales bacterium]|uniref:undecaprenyldiphospho-muramoylpentapeptide beta-N-acetylglucosaminyltransferase n=1 Tax=Clostridium sp. N3C TaxID=1776758 RepID=UPI00092DF15D|nr:undecaprenyldiphospho-muramoylpentapeptide beta-N-acetylglucosaminyltransferase [Clostridium sp. N3C]NLZ48714.1 undecaprenyldiphospho-muramoylpentapeptide beta-N-acetylglucosaminyltransferase [Clostridiales bacterium]SCN21263.1 UDP-N-acetylglucosamine-N-acetylmuramyl-(pentapeptide) pyrophosphoryl-undecaprenol N-acetylglucosamine transferase [Clostridium sp. N3C]